MDDALAVGIGQRLTDLLEDLQEVWQALLRAGALGEQFGKGAALHEFHGEEGATVFQLAQLVDGHHAGVL
jgi:hypothetical protein